MSSFYKTPITAPPPPPSGGFGLQSPVFPEVENPSRICAKPGGLNPSQRPVNAAVEPHRGQVTPLSPGLCPVFDQEGGGRGGPSSPPPLQPKPLVLLPMMKSVYKGSQHSKRPRVSSLRPASQETKFTQYEPADVPIFCILVLSHHIGSDV